MVRSSQKMEDLLVDHVSKTQFEDLPADVVDACKRLLIDTLGVAFPGSQAPGCRAVADLSKKWGSGSGSTVLIFGYAAAPPMAALANSMMMHALDFDDTLDASALHTFVSVLPAALAAAEGVEAVDGRQLIAALALGVDVICRLSLGINRPLSWIRTATCGAFGAAAAAGKMIGLNRDQMHDALGIVYSQTAGNAQGLIEGRLVKRMQPGFAARSGLTAAFLAQAGITGSRDFLEGRYGFYRLYEGGAYDIEPVISGLGRHYTILDLSIKPYPCCRMTHAAIDAALELKRTADVDIDHIRHIEVTASQMVADMVGKPFVIGTNPQVDAQFSIPYTVSTALMRNDVFLNDFEPTALEDRQVLALTEKVRVTADPELADKDIFHAAIKIHMKNGDCLDASVAIPRGNPKNPMSTADCLEKFRKCFRWSRVRLDADGIESLLEKIEHLEKMSDVRQMIASMSGEIPT